MTSLRWLCAASLVFSSNLALGVSRVSTDSAGVQGNNLSIRQSVSGDGRYVAFASTATNLVAGDTNARQDIFVKDMQTLATTRVSVDSVGTQQAGGDARCPAISADGRFVAFLSTAPNLVAGDTNGVQDVFVHDRQTGATTRVSLSSAGTQGNLASGQTTTNPAISADGRFVVFESSASNLVAGDTNAVRDVFLHDRQTATTSRVSVSSAGAEGTAQSASQAISGDGRFVAFVSTAANLVTGDTNAVDDVFVRDTLGGTTIRVSVSSTGAQSEVASLLPAFSGDGRFVAFASASAVLFGGDTLRFTDVFVRDLQTSTTSLVSVNSSGAMGSGISTAPTLSNDGRFVVFQSQGTNLHAGDINGVTDAFIHDRHLGETRLLSSTPSGSAGDAASQRPMISADGKAVIFDSAATNLVPGDTNGFTDVFYSTQLFASIQPVSPSPRTAHAGVLQILFSGAVVNVSADDFALTRDGVAVDTTSVSLFPFSASEYWLDLSTVTASPGAYTLRLPTVGTNITGTSGAALTSGDTIHWLTGAPADTTPPEVVSVRALTGSPAVGPFIQFEVIFSESVADISAAAFTLVENGITGSSVISVSPSSGIGGAFVITVRAGVGSGTISLRIPSPGGILDGASLSLSGANLPFTSLALTVEPGGHGITFAISRASASATAQSVGGSISADERFVLFETANAVWMRDLKLNTSTQVSLALDGSSAIGTNAVISADGRFVAYQSSSTNIVPGDTNSQEDIFLWNRQTGLTRRISVSAAGTQGNSYSGNTAISADGRFVAFDSNASNLVSGDTNGQQDAFIFDQATGTLERVSVSSAGVAGTGESSRPRVSRDGRFVAFKSFANNLVAGDTANADIFLRDRQAGTTTLVSVSSDGVKGNGDSTAVAISEDGRFLAFQSSASNLAAGDANGFDDIFVRDTVAGLTERISEASPVLDSNAASYLPSISDDGRFVAFSSYATNLSANATNSSANFYIRDRSTGGIVVADRPAGVTEHTSSINTALAPALSARGYALGFTTFAPNLAPGDTNSFQDVLVSRWLHADIAPVFPRNRHTTVGSVAVRFSQDVAGVGIGDFSFTRDGAAQSLAGATLTALSAREFVLDLSSVTTANGAYSLGLVATGSGITTSSGNLPIHRGDSESWTKTPVAVDTTPPLVAGIVRNGTTPTNADQLAFSVTFTEPVDGVDAADFQIAAGGASAQVGWVIPISSSAFSIIVTGVLGDGPLRLDVAPTASIADLAGNEFVGPYSGGEIYTVDNTPPALSISAPSAAIAATGPVSYTISYTGADSVTLATGNLTARYSGTAAGSVAVSGTGNMERTVTFSSLSGDGTANIEAVLSGTAADAAGNLALAAPMAVPFHIRNASPAAYQTLRRVSLDSFGREANSSSGLPAISANGRWIVFDSNATNLVPEVPPDRSDVFLHDRDTRLTTRISQTATGVGGNGHSTNPDISADGRFIVFSTAASNLGAPLISGILRLDRQSGVFTHASVSTAGIATNGSCSDAVISDDGRYIAFGSIATNLVTGDTNGATDIFVRDLVTSTTTRVSVTETGAQIPLGASTLDLSGDGRYVVFSSSSAGITTSDTNGFGDVFLHERQTGATSLLSRNAAGTVGNTASSDPKISSDGRLVFFSSAASNLVTPDNNDTEIFVRDLVTGTISRAVSAMDGGQPNGACTMATPSADGRFLGFYSMATNLVANPPSNAASFGASYLLDRATGVIELVSNNPLGAPSALGSSGSIPSADGRWLCFYSNSANLVPGDSNNTNDIFLTHRVRANFTPVSPDPRTTAAGLLTITFSEAVLPLGPDDFSLTRNGVPVNLTGIPISLVSPTQYTLDLSAVTLADGTYVVATSGDITDATFGDPLNTAASDTWEKFTLTFASWAATHSPSQQGPNDDPDYDGIVNLLEYAFGTHPSEPGSATAPTLVRIGFVISLSYPRLRAELIYTVEASADLVSWSSAGIDQDAVTPIGGTATATMPIAPETAHTFLRLRVTEP